MPSKATAKRLTEVRDAIAAAADALARLPDRPLPLDEAQQRACDWVDAKAAAADMRRRCTAFCAPAPSLDMDQLLSADASELRKHDIQADLGPVLAWLFPEQLKERLCAELEANPPTDALPMADREPERQRLEAELARLQAAEEIACRELEDSGQAVDRRDDADVSVILAPDEELADAAA